MDQETCELELVDYVAVVDCGTVDQPGNLARIQTEGGLDQGIGMALFEDVTCSSKGAQVYENSFMQYKLPSRMDVGTIRVEFESSYEPTGPFGAKSIGEVVINTPSPAIASGSRQCDRRAVSASCRSHPRRSLKNCIPDDMCLISGIAIHVYSNTFAYGFTSRK
ncbi:MAG: molybdopterin cofactor-binding domain-containing protein [Clostridium sp.]